MNNAIMMKILLIPGILLGFTIHEFAHAFIANRLGDPTPRMQGRLTLNPIKHVDPIGFLLILLVGFGWAKPVQTNPRNYKNGIKDDIKVSLAGIVGNLILAGFLGVMYRMGSSLVSYDILSSDTGLRIYVIIMNILQLAVSVNCMLAVFNLLPLPGLDGFHILRSISPSTFYKISQVVYQYQLLIMVALIFPIFGGSSIVSMIIRPIITLLTNIFI